MGMYRLTGKLDHTEPPVLYSLIIAQPSERKSPVMHMFKAPFDSYERQYNYDYREEIYKAQADKKALIAHAAAIEKSKEPDTAEIARLLVEADNIKGDNLLRIAIDNVTPEDLVYALSDSRTIMVISDETGMLNNFNGKHSYDGEEKILKLCDRANEIYVDFCNNYIEKKLKKMMPCCQDWGGKFHGEILRIVCILHCVKCCSRGAEPSAEEVSVDTIVRVNNLALYYQEQAVYGFGMNSPDI